MQSKTTMRSHSTPTRMAIIKKERVSGRKEKKKKTSVSEDVGKLEPSYMLVGM